MRWIDALLRWRTRRGFGVHSPFAYRMVCDVINGQYVYYDYAKLASRTERLLYRLAVFLQPSEIKQAGKAEARAAALACPNKGHRRPPKWVNEEETRLVVMDKHAAEADVMRYLSEDYCVFMYRPVAKSESSFLDRKGYGMIFDISGRIAIILPLRQLPRQNFRL